MSTTKEKVQCNLAGLEFLLSRPDTRTMPAQSDMLDRAEYSPAFFVHRAIMRDNLTVICVSLRVNITAFEPGGERYFHRDITGRGTTFEMALFDLSAQAIQLLGDNEHIDTESIPIIEERMQNGQAQNSNTSVRPDTPDTAQSGIETTQQDERPGMAARGDNSSGSRSDGRRDSRGKRKAENRSRGRSRSKRAGG